MITNVSKKVICIKEIPSNMIEEAIFILKNDVPHSQNEKMKNRRKEILEDEANFFLNDYMKIVENEKRQEKKKKHFRGKTFDIVFFTFFTLIACYLTLTIFTN